MTLAGIELRYLVTKISSATDGYYTSNIYGISRSSLLFKLHHPDRPDIFLMVSTLGVWPSRVRIQQIEPNRLLGRLRRDLLRLKISDIRQIGAERIAYISFAGFDKEFVLVCEFFSDGNIILCDKDMKILALLHSVDVRHRQLRVGLQYAPPPAGPVDIFEMDRSELDGMRDSDISCAKWIGRNLGLPTRYTEEICRRAQIDAKAAAGTLDGQQRDLLYDTIVGLAGSVARGDHEPVLADEGGRSAAYPIRLAGIEGKPVDDFVEALDMQFTGEILEGGRQAQEGQSGREMAQLQNRLAEQDRAVQTVMERSRHLSRVAQTVQSLASQGVMALDEGAARGPLADAGAELISERGVPKIRVSDQRVPVSGSMQAIASRLYDESKRQAAAVSAIQETRKETEERLRRLGERVQKDRDSIGSSAIRERRWFERYRWFYTSEGYLAIGGRDAPSNSAVVRKHMKKGDIVFHAEIFGSPFFILKGGADAGPASLTEAAQATVCFSRGWREAMHGIDAYWVEPDQVKKSAPSGQFLPKGSFTIEGRRNFVKAGGMKLAVGLVSEGNDILLTCGPVDSIKGRCRLHCIIEPTGGSMTDTAKRIRLEFLKADADIARPFSIDDYVRVLPAGGSHMVGSVQ